MLRRSLIVALLGLAAARSAAAAVIEVTTISDGSGGPACTLRDAIVAANQNAPWGGCAAGDGYYDSIDLSGLRGTIAIYEPLPALDGGYDAVRIRGPGADLLAIDGVAANGSVFVNRTFVDPDTTIEGVTIRSGVDTCVRNEGWLTLRDCRITDCHSSGGGAAIDSGDVGIVTFVDRCLIDANGGGPAIRVGGVAGSGSLRLQNSTVSGNESGIVVDAEGPGGPHYLYASTIADNGPLNLDVEADDQVTIQHVILKRSVGGANCSLGGIVFLPPETQQISAVATIADDASCSLGPFFSLEGVDPLIGPLADNGGPTSTRALLPGSPAIDGPFPLCSGFPSALEVDQRGSGHPRPVAATPGAEPRCDIGAFEVPEPHRAGLELGVVLAIALLVRRRPRIGRKSHALV